MKVAIKIVLIIVFSLSFIQTKAQLTDQRDGQVYPTVKIAGKWWMAKNLNYATPEGSVYYNNDSTAYASTYGRLYTWSTASTACPSGWHLPTHTDWKQLELSLGISSAAYKPIEQPHTDHPYLGTNQGGLLKAVSTEWKNPNTGANNSTGFNAFPGGLKFGQDAPTEYQGKFGDLGYDAQFWASQYTDSASAYVRCLVYNNSKIHIFDGDKSAYRSVRCVENGPLSFVSNEQSINNFDSRGVALGDFNGDGFVDAIVANNNAANNLKVYLNNGSALFSDNGQQLKTPDTWWDTPVVGDINHDGKPEIITNNIVWESDGHGHFTENNSLIDKTETGNIDIGKLSDLNHDGHPDLFVIRNYAAMRVYLNDGTGKFTNSGQKLGDGTIGSGQVALLALGDINQDGHIDAVSAGWKWNGSTQSPNHIWLNDGHGNFTDSGQNLDLGSSHVHGLAIGDLNGDGCPDIVFGIQDNSRAGRIYLNDGTGKFPTGTNFGTSSGEKVVLSDFDSDGDLDIFLARSTPPSQIWLNNGAGSFTNSGLSLGTNCTWDGAVADLNNDGNPDVFTVGFVWGSSLAPAPAKIWLNNTWTGSFMPVSSISLNTGSRVLAPGKTDSLKATIHPDIASIQQLTWKSTKPSVVSVDQTGKINALAAGETIIIATSLDGNYSDSCYVQVKEGTNNRKYSTSSFFIHPNPAKEEIMICSIEQSDTDVRFLLVSSNGKKIMEGKNDGSPIKIGHLPGGIYLLTIQDQNRFYHQKLIIESDKLNNNN